MHPNHDSISLIGFMMWGPLGSNAAFTPLSTSNGFTQSCFSAESCKSLPLDCLSSKQRRLIQLMCGQADHGPVRSICDFFSANCFLPSPCTHDWPFGLNASNLTLLQRVEEGFFCCACCGWCFCIPVSRSMVRKGWTQTDVLSGWVQILRGPRPPSQNGRRNLQFRARSLFADRTDAIFSQTRATCEPRQQPRSCSCQGEVGEGVGGDGRHKWSCCRLFEGRVGESSECGEAATSPAGGGRVPQVHHSVRKAHFRAGRRTILRDEGTRQGQRMFGAVGSRASKSPKGCFISAGSCAPGGLGCRGPEIARGIDASARTQSHSFKILPKFFRGCQHAAGEGCKTSCRSCRVSAHQSTRCGTVVVKKHLELHDAIEFGDKESILAVTDLMQQGVRQCHNLLSTVNSMVV